MARGLVVTLPPLRPRKAKSASIFLRKPVGTGIYLPPGARASGFPSPLRGGVRGGGPTARTPSLPLLDPLRSPLSLSKGRPRRPAANGIPRISLPGLTRPFPVESRRPPAPDDPLDATGLALRLAALGAALDDLPGQAKRFARWKARKQAGRTRRISPLRPGRPPGGRLSRYDPTATHPRRIREVDEILAHAHALAVYALAASDTS